MFCSQCGNQVEQAARFCSKCGAAIDGRSSSTSVSHEHVATTPVALEAVPATVSADQSKPAADYGIFLLITPIVAVLLIWFWVAGMSLIQSPGSTLALIVVATVVITAILAAVEAHKVDMFFEPEKGSYGPISWFFMFVIMWVIGYPIYLFKRRHFGLSNLLIGGLFVDAIFVISIVYMQISINDATSAVISLLK
ncbi:MAG: zinc-ribbon domain-containing protein [Ktedonobacteraceae bacterium]